MKRRQSAYQLRHWRLPTTRFESGIVRPTRLRFHTRFPTHKIVPNLCGYARTLVDEVSPQGAVFSMGYRTAANKREHDTGEPRTMKTGTMFSRYRCDWPSPSASSATCLTPTRKSCATPLRNSSQWNEQRSLLSMRGSAYKPKARPGTRRQCPERSEPQGRARNERAGLTVRPRAWHPGEAVEWALLF